jgi:hypothetical protein
MKRLLLATAPVLATTAALWALSSCAMAQSARYYSPTASSNCSGIDDQKLMADCLAHVAKMQSFYKQCESTRRTPAYTQCLYGTTEQDFLHSLDREAHLRMVEEYRDERHRFGIPEDEDPGGICRHAEHIPQCLEAWRAWLNLLKTEKEI